MRALATIGWVLLYVTPIVALWLVFMEVPNERTMGEVQRIFYFHVTSAMAAFLSFFVVMVASVAFLASRRERWDYLALTCAEVGVVFMSIVLVTGPLWARPVWGTYWVWQDARLVTSFVLWIYFVLYLFLRRAWGDDLGAKRFAAVLGIVGFADVPLIYLSVRWWNYIHPSHVVGPMGGGLDPVMARALGVAALAVLAIWIALVVARVRLEFVRAGVRELTIRADRAVLGKGEV